MRRRLGTAVILAAGALLPLAAGAAEVETLCSGVGAEERQAADAAHFTLKVVAAEAKGDFVADFTTRIMKDGVEIAGRTCEGPWFLAMLPAGTYTVEATYQGKTESRTVDVTADRTREVTFGF